MLIHPSHIDNYFSFGKKNRLLKFVFFCRILAKCKMSVLTQRLFDKLVGILSLLFGCMKTIMLYTLQSNLVTFLTSSLRFKRSDHKTTFTALFGTEHFGWAEANVNTKFDQGPRFKLFTVLDSPTNKESLVYPRAELLL